MHLHHLTGCSPQPLAHYLKGLGIIRLVAEQADPDACAWWQDEQMMLATALDKEQLISFFLNDYKPSAIIAPWNKGSGFVFAQANPTLDVIRNSQSVRFSEFKAAIELAFQQTSELAKADDAIRVIKGESKIGPDGRRLTKTEAEAIRESPAYKARLRAAEAKFKALKENDIPAMRRSWRGSHLNWFDSAMSLGPDGKIDRPSILGSGGNDGKNDFTKQYMESLGKLMELSSPEAAPLPQATPWLETSLFEKNSTNSVTDLPVGQFLPGQAGGANMTAGFDANAGANPWDYVLMIEGSLVLLPTITKKASSRQAFLAAPFAVRGQSTGYASASAPEGSERGEQWMPLWSNPATLQEIRALFGAGRVQLGRGSAGRSVDFARAVARLGTARGVSQFQRFGYLERNGQSNLAIPLGRWQVVAQPNQELLDDLDRFGWIDAVRRAASDKNAPKSFTTATMVLDEAIMAVCSHGNEPDRWQNLLMALAELEAQMLSSGKFTKDKNLRPIPALSQGWARAADNGSPEYRLALALAAQSVDGRGHNPVRMHWLPLDGFRFAQDASGLRKEPAVVCFGASLEDDLTSLVQRRLVMATRGAGALLPLQAPDQCTARLSDIRTFLAYGLDDRRVLSLARSLMALERPQRPHSTPGQNADLHELALFALFRLVCLPWKLPRGSGEVHVRCDPAIVSRLAAGDLATAGQMAIARLSASGLRPKIRHVVGSPQLARRLASALAFPISGYSATLLAECLLKTSDDN